MKNIFFAMMLAGATPLLAQDAPAEAPKAWKYSGVGTITVTNTGFGKYWQNGAVSSLGLSSRAQLEANYKSAQGGATWDNLLKLAYGSVRQGGKTYIDGKGVSRTNPFLKSDDQIDFTSKYGKTLKVKNLSVAGLANFRTQFAPGYASRDAALADTLEGGPSTRNSQFLNPAYFNLSIGLDWKPKDEANNKFTVYYSPINAKVTIATDLPYRRAYFGATADTTKSARFELGSYLNVRYKHAFKAPALDNITVESAADFFFNYLATTKSVDVNWTNLVGMQVNKYISASLFTHLVYDKDIQFDLVEGDKDYAPGAKGARWQFKHVFGIGFTYAFGAKK